MRSQKSEKACAFPPQDFCRFLASCVRSDFSAKPTILRHCVFSCLLFERPLDPLANPKRAFRASCFSLPPFLLLSRSPSHGRRRTCPARLETRPGGSAALCRHLSAPPDRAAHLLTVPPPVTFFPSHACAKRAPRKARAARPRLEMRSWRGMYAPTNVTSGDRETRPRCDLFPLPCSALSPRYFLRSFGKASARFGVFVVRVVARLLAFPRSFHRSCLPLPSFSLWGGGCRSWPLGSLHGPCPPVWGLGLAVAFRVRRRRVRLLASPCGRSLTRARGRA